MRSLKELLLSDNPSLTFKELHEAGELEVWIPELAALDLKDKPSQRHKNNFYHSLKVLKQAIELEGDKADLILRTAALFHDVGKPATREFKDKRTVTFHKHESVGARMAREILKKHAYSKSEIKLISELILNHMRSFNFDPKLWTDSAMRRLLKDFPQPEQLARLFKLFKADVTTKHDNRRLAIYSKVDELEANVERVRLSELAASRRPALNGNEVMEAFSLEPGRKLGAIMKYLNTEEGLKLSKEEILKEIPELFVI